MGILDIICTFKLLVNRVERVMPIFEFENIIFVKLNLLCFIYTMIKLFFLSNIFSLPVTGDTYSIKKKGEFRNLEHISYHHGYALNRKLLWHLKSLTSLSYFQMMDSALWLLNKHLYPSLFIISNKVSTTYSSSSSLPKNLSKLSHLLR